MAVFVQQRSTNRGRVPVVLTSDGLTPVTVDGLENPWGAAGPTGVAVMCRISGVER